MKENMVMEIQKEEIREFCLQISSETSSFQKVCGHHYQPLPLMNSPKVISLSLRWKGIAA